MDDLMLNNSCKPNLLSLKGKDWSSLQNLDSEDSEETSSELNYHQNGYLNRIRLVNGGEYTTNSSDDSCLPVNHDTTKLNREDMCIFGLRPAYDEFYLAVCEHCSKVFKPQALFKHIELRHSNNEINEHTLDNLGQLRSEESSSLTEDDFNIHKTPDNHNLRSLLSSTTSSSLLANNTTKDDLDLEKLKHKQSLLSCLKSNSSSNSTTASSPLNLPSQSDCLANKRPPTKPKLLPCKDRKYDPDKHCGVRSSENDRPCTRSLTCKTHSLTLRRSVHGRRDSFDNLLNQHRLAKEAELRAAGFEVKPTKLQLKQQQRMLKSNLLKEQQQKDALQQTNSNSSSLSNPSTQQFKLHLQPLNSPSSSLTTSPSFKAFNQLHQQPESSSIFQNKTSSFNNNTALQSPTATNSFVNLNNLQFTSSSSNNVKQFTFGNQQLGKLLSSPSRQPTTCTSSSFNNSLINSSSTSVPNNQPQPGILSSSIQVINQTNLLNSNYSNFDTNKNYSSTISSVNGRPFVCDLSTATLNHYPKPAAVCTFNERRLSIFSPSNKQILSSKLFNRKQDYTYSALSVFCNKERMINETINAEPNELNRKTTPIKQTNHTKYKSNSNSLISNSQSNSRTDFYSSNSNSQESCSPFDRNGLSSSPLSRKSSSDLANDHPIAKSYLYGYTNRSNSILVSDKDADKQFNNVNTSPMNF